MPQSGDAFQQRIARPDSDLEKTQGKLVKAAFPYPTNL